MESLARQGHPSAQQSLVPPPLASGDHAVWALFVDLDAWRGAGGMGPMPLTLHDISAYEQRHGVRLEAATLAHLKLLDAVRLTPAPSAA